MGSAKSKQFSAIIGFCMGLRLFTMGQLPDLTLQTVYTKATTFAWDATIRYDNKVADQGFPRGVPTLEDTLTYFWS